MCKKIIVLIAIISCIFYVRNIFAGPPFLTDDPVPTDYKHDEIFPFISSDNTQANSNILGPAVEIDYGALPNLELNITAPINSVITHSQNGKNAVGLGDIELGMVYRFLQESKFFPQIAFTPAYFVPTGDSNRGLGNGRPFVTLPFWAQKSWEPWTFDLGGGYTINPAPDAINNFFGGILLQRDINEKWTLGGEIFLQGAASQSTPYTDIVNLGGNYNITKNVSLLLSAGHSFKGAVHFITYLGLDILV